MKTLNLKFALIGVVTLVSTLWQPHATAHAATPPVSIQLDVLQPTGVARSAGVFAVVQRQLGGRWQDVTAKRFWLSEGSGSVSWPLMQRGVYRWVLRDPASFKVLASTRPFSTPAPGQQLKRVLVLPKPAAVAPAAPKQGIGSPGPLPGPGAPLPGLAMPDSGSKGPPIVR